MEQDSPPCNDQLECEVNRIRNSLKPLQYYRKVIRVLDEIERASRKRGRPRRRRLPRGGSSRSKSDLLIITSLKQGKSRVREICNQRGLARSTVYRRLFHLKARGLTERKGRPAEWTLIDDDKKISGYMFEKARGLKEARVFGLKELRLLIESDMELAKGGDEAIREHLLHYGDREDFLRNWRPKQKKLEDTVKFIETERRRIWSRFPEDVSEQEWHKESRRSPRQ